MNIWACAHAVDDSGRVCNKPSVRWFKIPHCLDDGWRFEGGAVVGYCDFHARFAVISYAEVERAEAEVASIHES
jgi:hypothetical protein